MKKKFRVVSNSLLLVIIFFITPYTFNTNINSVMARATTSNCDDPVVQITISEAYYADLDADGVTDDVFAKVFLDLFCSNRFQFDYYIYLTFPSSNYVYDAYLVNTRLDHLTAETSFFNYATESGDYRIDVYVVLKNGGPTVMTEYLIFDPPGGAGGVGTMSTLIY